MEEFNDEERIQETVQHGKKNQRTARKITNWCRNARIARSGGIGIVEQMTGVPIGLMGIECDHAPAGGLHCWDLEDAAINFYLSNCESCQQRSPGTGQGIESLIEAYKKREKERTDYEQKQRAEEERRQAAQLSKLERLRVPGDEFANQIVDLLVAIVEATGATSGTALVDLACLAPETFSTEIVEFLREQMENQNDKLEIPALRTLLLLSIDEETKLQFAVRNASKLNVDEHATRYLKEHVQHLSRTDIAAILPNIAVLARPITGIPNLERKPDLEPILAIAKHHPEDTTLVLTDCLNSGNPRLLDAAFRSISVLVLSLPNVVRPLLRNVLAKLLRRNHLLPGFEPDAGDDRLQVVRSMAVALFRRFPEEADSVIQSLLEGAGEPTRSEAALVYSGVLETQWNRPTVAPGAAEEIAFPRILWMAVDDPFHSLDNRATQFFSYVNLDLLPIAVKHADSILGAAATLSSRVPEQESQTLLAAQKSQLDELERIRRRNSIYLFQSNLIAWAFKACYQEGMNGIRRALSFYDALPETEVEMRASVVKHLSMLMGNASTVNSVMPHLYTAMTSPEALIRASAARSLGDISHQVRRDLPDLVFEVNLVLLTDPNVYVHQEAVRSLRIYDFPEKLKNAVASSLITLIYVYQQTQDDQMFVVDLLRKYAHGCLTDTQLAGKEGAFVVSSILQMDELYARNALDSLGTLLVHSSGIVPLCIKTLGVGAVDYTRRDGVLRVLERVPVKIVKLHARDIAESALKFSKTEPYITNFLFSLLAKADCWKAATDLCKQVLSRISDTRRERLLRFHYEGLRQVCEFEAAREIERISVGDAMGNWASLQQQKEEEGAERDARESFRPFFFE